MLLLVAFILELFISAATCGSIKNINVNVNTCVAVHGKASTVRCHSIPSCTQQSFNVLRGGGFNKIIFDLPNTFKLEAYTFENCNFSWSSQIELEFRNIKQISEFAFANLLIDSNTRVSVKLEPGDLNKARNLIIKKNAFKNMQLNAKSQFLLEISNYKQVIVQDSLIETILQKENSAIHLSIHDVDEVTFSVRNSSQTSTKDLNTFVHNRTYSLLVNNVNSFSLERGLYTALRLSPYSMVSFKIKSLFRLRIAEAAFEYLKLSAFSQFELIVQGVSWASVGSKMFNELNQAAYSSLYLQLDQIGKASTGSKQRSPDDYYDYYDEEPMEEWFCVPENLFQNVVQSESAVAKIHLTNFHEVSISVSSMAFNHLELSENSRFQVIFSDVKGHIVMDKKAFDFIRVAEGIFEVWIENHRQSQSVKGNKQSFSNPKSFGSLLKNVGHTYLKLNDQAFNKVFLSARSYFHLSFINSDSIFLINPASLNGFHEDSLSTVSRGEQDERTKILIDLNESDNFRFEFLSEQALVDNQQDLNYLPRVIEIEQYTPSLSILSRDGTIDLTRSMQSLSFDSNRTRLSNTDLIRSNSYLISEFCRFYKLRPLMAQFKFKISQVLDSSYLVYFSEPVSLSSEYEHKNVKQPALCSSCLFIYLYRTVHRREDFYFVKDHLPSCFLNLHYENNMYFSTLKSQAEQLEAIAKIEQGFVKYWHLMNCAHITGIEDVFQYENNEMLFNGDESYLDQNKIEQHCLRESRSLNEAEIKHVSSLKQAEWQRFASTVCKSNHQGGNVQNNVKIAMKKSNSKPQAAKFSWTLFWLVLISVVAVLLGLVYWKNRRMNRPCLTLKFQPNIKSFKRLNNTDATPRRSVKSSPQTTPPKDTGNY